MRLVVRGWIVRGGFRHSTTWTTGCIKHLGLFRSLKVIGAMARDHARLSVRGVNRTTPSSWSYYIDVSTWRMIHSIAFVSALGISVELAQTCVVRGVFGRIRCTYLCTVTAGHLTAHVPSHAHERTQIAGYVCSPHGMSLFV